MRPDACESEERDRHDPLRARGVPSVQRTRDVYGDAVTHKHDWHGLIHQVMVRHVLSADAFGLTMYQHHEDGADTFEHGYSLVMLPPLWWHHRRRRRPQTVERDGREAHQDAHERKKSVFCASLAYQSKAHEGTTKQNQRAYRIEQNAFCVHGYTRCTKKKTLPDRTSEGHAAASHAAHVCVGGAEAIVAPDRGPLYWRLLVWTVATRARVHATPAHHTTLRDAHRAPADRPGEIDPAGGHAKSSQQPVRRPVAHGSELSRGGLQRQGLRVYDRAPPLSRRGERRKRPRSTFRLRRTASASPQVAARRYEAPPVREIPSSV